MFSAAPNVAHLGDGAPPNTGKHDMLAIHLMAESADWLFRRAVGIRRRDDRQNVRMGPQFKR